MHMGRRHHLRQVRQDTSSNQPAERFASSLLWVCAEVIVIVRVVVRITIFYVQNNCCHLGQAELPRPQASLEEVADLHRAFHHLAFRSSMQRMTHLSLALDQHPQDAQEAGHRLGVERCWAQPASLRKGGAYDGRMTSCIAASSGHAWAALQ